MHNILCVCVRAYVCLCTPFPYFVYGKWVCVGVCVGVCVCACGCALMTKVAGTIPAYRFDNKLCLLLTNVAIESLLAFW